jgi:hypothetical protein
MPSKAKRLIIIILVILVMILPVLYGIIRERFFR